MRSALFLATVLGAGTLMAAESGPVVAPAPSAPAPAAAPAPVPLAIGRLFFTPRERAQLDVARMQKKTPQVAAAEADAAPAGPPPPQTVSYGGIVRRSDGRAMLWINNRLVEEKDALSGLSLKGRVRSDGAVTLQVPETGASINVKVGQSVEVQTGKVGETRRPETKGSTADAKAAAPDAKGAAADTKGGAPDGAQPAAEAADKSASTTGPVGARTEPGGRRPEQPEVRSRPAEGSLK